VPVVEVGAHRKCRNRIHARLQVVEQELDALDAHDAEDLVQLADRVACGARSQGAVPAVRQEVAQLVGLAAGLVRRPQLLGERDVLAGERVAKGLFASGRGGSSAGQREQRAELGVAEPDADALRHARDRAQLELEAVRGGQAATVEQHVLCGLRRRRRRAQAVQGGDTPAEIDRPGDLPARRSPLGDRRCTFRAREGRLPIGLHGSSSMRLSARLRRAAGEPCARASHGVGPAC